MRDGKEKRIGQKAITGGRFLPQGPRRRKHEKTSKSALKPQAPVRLLPRGPHAGRIRFPFTYRRNMLIGRPFACLDGRTCIGI